MSEFILGDCMEYMRKMPDNTFDLAIVDPPYGIKVTSRHKMKQDAAPLVGGGRPFGGTRRLRERQTTPEGGG